MNFLNANETGIKNKATVVGMMEATINTCRGKSYGWTMEKTKCGKKGRDIGQFYSGEKADLLQGL